MAINSIDLLRETIVSFAQAARRVPPTRGEKPTSPSTIWRWFRRGCKAADGRVVHLEAVRLGGRWVTSLESLARFCAALTGGASLQATPPDRPSTRTGAQRLRDSQHAEVELSKVGI
jgi:hypothetical protein